MNTFCSSSCQVHSMQIYEPLNYKPQKNACIRCTCYTTIKLVPYWLHPMNHWPQHTDGLLGQDQDKGISQSVQSEKKSDAKFACHWVSLHHLGQVPHTWEWKFSNFCEGAILPTRNWKTLGSHNFGWLVYPVTPIRAMLAVTGTMN